MMIQASNLDAIRTTLSAAKAAPATAEAQADVILQLSTAATQLLSKLALAAPLQWGPRPVQDAGSPPDVSVAAVALSIPRCPPSTSTLSF